MIVNSWSAGKKAVAGYGLAMLMVFLATTVMVGASMQMMAAPITMAYLGAASQDNLAAQQLAQAGMDVIQADLQTKFDTGVAITTGYSYPLTSMSMPDSPDALGGATSTVGSYSGAIGVINGNTALVKVTATVGVGTYTYNKLIALSRSIYPLDNVAGATAAYGLRKLDKDYAGSAIRVRRASDDTEQDIGFDASGGLDKAALLTFLNGGVTTYPKPLDSVGSAAAAYSLRKLRTAYTGSAIRVRRSSDSTELDIGFTSSGDLDVSALVDFVGTGSGYVTTWYDQSGNARNATNATTSEQPRIVNAGVIDTINNRPAVRGLGGQVLFGPSASIMAGTGGWHYLTVIGDYGSNTNKYYIDRNCSVSSSPLATLKNTSDAFSLQKRLDDNTSFGDLAGATVIPTDGSPQIMSYQRERGKFYTLFFNGVANRMVADTDGNITPVGPAILGHCNNTAFRANAGIGELIIYASHLSTANRQLVENDQARYYGLTMADLGFAKPLDTVTGAAAAYGLRKLRTAYAGNAIQVRRSSDNATGNVGFDTKDNLNISALMNFCGTASCYVSTWYDQSGNARDASQATAGSQPRIVNAGVLETQNGRPAVYFNSASLTLTTEVTAIGDYSAFGIGRFDTSAYPGFYFLSSSAINRQILRILGNSPWNFDGTVDVNCAAISGITGKQLSLNIIRSGTNSTATYNGVSYAMSPASGGAMQFGLISGFGPGWISETLLYTSALSTDNRQTVEYNQMSYYNINSAAPGTGFVTKWYDQSGNSRDVSQPTTLLQPTLLWDNRSNQPVISFNGRSNSLYRTDGFPTNSDYTKNAVFSYRDASRTNNIISTYQAGGGTHALFLGNTNYLRLFHNGSFAISATAMTINQPYTVFGTYNNATMEGITYQGVTQVGVGTATVNISNASLVLGAHGGSNFLDGTISEATIYSRILNATERQLLYGDQSVYWMTP